MLIWTQLTSIFLLTDVVTVHTEKIFHNRDHSDVDVHAPHHAELIVDTDTARQFLSKYGFLKPLRLDESQSKEADYILGGERLHMRIQEGRSASRTGIETDVSANIPDLISGLRQFQVMSGLPETGVFDDATKAAMNKPRCGVPDRLSPTGSSVKDNSTGSSVKDNSTGSSVKDNSTGSSVKDNSTGSAPADPVASNATINITDDQSDRNLKPASPRQKRHLLTLLSKRRSKQEAGNLRQIAFSKQLLKWRLIGEGYSSQLSIDDQRYIFKLAFRMWSEVSPLDFVEDVHSPLAEIDIRLGFGTGRHLGCTQAFDGAGQEFAHAWFLGDIHFDDDEHFTAPNTGYGISLLKVAVHEIGHVLGLPHIFRPGSIMQPSYLPQDTGFEIDWLDRKAIQKLYGGCRGHFSTVFDWIRKERTPYGEVVVRFNTYFMRGGWYWMYENRNNRTRYGDPVAVQMGWHGVPSNGVDAYVHVWTWTTDAAYFFKGTQYWRYDGENDEAFTEDSEGCRYPRLISEGFPGVPSPIDTAFYDRRDSLIYFFKGKDVYAFHVGTHAVVSGYPKKIREAFPALVPGDHPVGHLDAAYLSYTHNAVFLLKGTRFWRLLGTREQRLKPSLPRNSLLPGKEVDQQWFDICDVHKTNLKMLG